MKKLIFLLLLALVPLSVSAMNFERYSITRTSRLKYLKKDSYLQFELKIMKEGTCAPTFGTPQLELQNLEYKKQHNSYPRSPLDGYLESTTAPLEKKDGFFFYYSWKLDCLKNKKDIIEEINKKNTISTNRPNDPLPPLSVILPVYIGKNLVKTFSCDLPFRTNANNKQKNANNKQDLNNELKEDPCFSKLKDLQIQPQQEENQLQILSVWPRNMSPESEGKKFHLSIQLPKEEKLPLQIFFGYKEVTEFRFVEEKPAWHVEGIIPPYKEILGPSNPSIDSASFSIYLRSKSGSSTEFWINGLKPSNPC